MKKQTQFKTNAAQAALDRLKAAVQAYRDNESELEKERLAEKTAVESLSLADLDNDEIITAASKRDVRLRIRVKALETLSAKVAEACRDLQAEFLELLGDLADAAKAEKLAFLAEFEKLVAPFGQPADPDTLARLTAPFARLQDSIEGLGDISRETEQDIFERANFYSTRTGFAFNMIEAFNKAGKFFPAA